MEWLLREDAALKERLTGIILPSLADPVPVRFSVPEPEQADMTYPIIIITRRDINEAHDRAHRGTVQISYGREGQPLPAEGDRWGWYAEHPIPYDIDYQVSVYTRLEDDRTRLIGTLARQDRISSRYGALYIPEFDCQVSMIVQAGPTCTSRTDGDNKRIFEVYYLVRVSTEMTPWDIDKILYPDRVAGTIESIGDGNEVQVFGETYGE